MEVPTIKDIHIGMTKLKDPKIEFFSDEENTIYTMGRNQKGYIWLMEQHYETKDHRFHKIENNDDKAFINYFSDFMRTISLPFNQSILNKYRDRIKKFEYHLCGMKPIIKIPTLPLPLDHKWFGLDDKFCMMLKQGYIYDASTGSMTNDD
jgi:hypothetical protein